VRGKCGLSGYELTTHFEEDWLVIRKYKPGLIFTVVYYDGEQKLHYIKRFEAEAMEKPSRYFEEHPKSKFILLSEKDFPRLELKFGGKQKKKDPVILEAADFIAVKGYKAKGKRLSNYEVAVVNELEPLRFKADLPVPPVEELPDEPVPGDEEPKLPEGGDTGEQMSLF